MDSMKHRRLQEMDRSDFEVVTNDPDIRGWDVRNSNGSKIGEVEELIVDAQKKKVRYMVVDMDDNELTLKRHKVLIPIGLARLDKDDDNVILKSVGVNHLKALPKYDPDHLDDKEEQRICKALGLQQDDEHQVNTTDVHQADRRTAAPHDDFYQHDYFNEENLYKNRHHEVQLAQHRREQENSREQDNNHGLRISERRIDNNDQYNNTGDRMDREREITDQRRIEMVQNRRRMYEDRRGSRTERKDHSGNRRHQQRDDRQGRNRHSGPENPIL